VGWGWIVSFGIGGAKWHRLTLLLGSECGAIEGRSSRK
jgi:hypothetical protein